MPLLRVEQLTDLVTTVFLNSKTSKINAKIVAEALIKAELDGLSSHGLARVESYVGQAISQKVDGYAEPAARQLSSAALQVDAKFGFSYPAIDIGLNSAIDLVVDAGIVGLSIKNSHHAGVLGHHVEKIANAGYIGIGFSNSPSALAPWLGNRSIFGTNPIAFSCPREDDYPLIVDLSLSKVARGKILLASKEDKPIPNDWALDKEGFATTNAHSALAGSLLPIAEAKGAALALMVEILSASLARSNYGFEASSFFSAKGSPPGIGQFFLIINAAMFGGDSFHSRIEDLVLAILDQPETRLPGERRFKIREKTLAEGINVSKKDFAYFKALATNVPD